MSDAINMHHTTKHNKLGYCHLNGFRNLHAVIVKVDVDIVRNDLSNIIVLKGQLYIKSEFIICKRTVTHS